jgi:transposase InsO family protein
MAKQKVLCLRSNMPHVGTRKLYYLLKESFVKEGIPLGRDGLFDLLREEALLIVKKRRYTKTTNSKHWMHKYPDLTKDITLCRPEQLWVADITYVALKDRFCYLHLITDAYSKKIMGYSLSKDLAATSTVKALQEALAKRTSAKALMHHSDRGLQYCSALYTNILKSNDVAISMTESGSPYDNAIAERVNGILKDEYGLDETFEDLQQLNKQVKQAINSYNQQRPHYSNHMLTPNQMHQQNNLRPKAWHKKTTRTFESSCGFLPSRTII